MRLKPLIWIFVFLLSLNIADAVIGNNTMRTTFDTFANGSASLSLGNYTIAFGSLEGIGTVINGFNNESATNMTNVSAGTRVSRTVGHFNFTSSASVGRLSLQSGLTSRGIPKGTACDIQYRPDSGQAQIGFGIGLEINTGIGCGGGTPSAGRACIAPGNDGNQRIALQTSVAGFTNIGHKAAIGETVNVTVIYGINGSNDIFVATNNSARANATITGETLDVLTNMSIAVANGDPSLVGMNVSAFICYNATLGAPMTASAPPDTTAPIVNTSFNITSPIIGNILNYTANITDETGLSTANWTVNLSSGLIKANYTLSGTSAQVSNTTRFTSGGVFNFTVYATDTNNNVKQNSTLVIVSDTIPPIINVSINNTSSKRYDLINISANITDETGLLFANITINFSTGIVKINYTISGTSISIYNITNITDPQGNLLLITFYATDINNNVKQNSTLINVVNSISTPTIILPTPNDYNSTIPYNFSITYPSDVDGDTISEIRYYINGKLNQTTNPPANVTFNASDGYYILNVSIFDGIGYSANVTVNFTIDTTFPVLTIFNFSNNTRIGYVNGTLLVQIDDANPYNLSINVYNTSNDRIYYIYNDTTYGATNLRILTTLNLTQLGSGSYTIDVNFSDTHTREEILDYGISKGINEKKLSFYNYENEDNLGIQLIKSDIPLDNFMTYKNVDRYVINYDFSNISKNSALHTYVFSVTSKESLTYLQNSRYNAHFITSKNWIDFNLLNGEAEYSVSKIDDKMWKITITTIETNLIFKSIGGLNQINMFFVINIDNSAPSFPAQSINKTIPSVNDIIAVSFNCSDNIGLSMCIIGHNNTGIWVNATNVTMPNNNTLSLNYTYNHTVTTEGRTIGFMACANDTFNKFSCSDIFTVLVNDTTTPIINGTLNNTRFLVNMSVNVTFNATDNSVLSAGQIIITEDAITRYFNFSLSGASAEFSQNFSIKTEPNNLINITGLVNDSQGNKRQNTSIIYVTKDLIVNAVNSYDNTSINNFSIRIFNSSFSDNKTTSNGSIDFLDIIKGNYSFEFNSTENGGYFNRTFINETLLNDTRTLKLNSFQTIVYIFAKQRGTNKNITSFNVSMTKIANISNSTGALRLYLNASSYQISGYSNGYFDIIQNFSFANVSTNNIFMQFYTMNVSISVYSTANNTFLKNYTVKLTGDISDFSENLTDNNQGNVTFSLTNNTYKIIISLTQFSPLSTSFTENGSSIYPNLTFTMIGLNSLNITIYDELTNALLLKNVTLQFIGNMPVINKSTDNGSLYVQDLSADEYRIRYSTVDYRLRDYYVNVPNGTNASIKLYLLNIGNGTLTKFTITNQVANPAINVTVKGQRYFTTQNAYEIVVMGRTDAQGETQIDLQQNDPFYKFLIVDVNGKILLDTVPAKIFAATYSLKITTEGNSFEDIRNRGLIFNNLTFSNTSNSFTFTYNDKNSLGVSTCLLASEISLKGESSICNVCSSSSSATLVCPVNTSYIANKTLIAKAFTYGATGSGGINSTAILLDELVITPTKLIQEVKEVFGKVGILMGMFIIITMISIALWNPVIAMLFGTFGFIFSYMIGFISLGASAIQWIVGILLLAGIIAYRSRA